MKQKSDSFTMLDKTKHICETAAKHDGALREFISTVSNSMSPSASNHYISLYNCCREVHKFAWDSIVLLCSGSENFYSLTKVFEISMEELYDLRYLVKRKVLNIIYDVAVV